MQSAKTSLLILFMMLFLSFGIVNAKNNSNTISFDNQSGEQALVKLVGPPSQIVNVEHGQKKTVNVKAGEYYILVRYGHNPERYRYSKGETFEIRQSETKYYAISITLHKVVDGNYQTNETSSDEFEKALLPVPNEKPGENDVYRVQKVLTKLGYKPGPIDGIWGGKTEASLKAFQQTNNFPVTGKLDPQTKQKLLHNTDKIQVSKIAVANLDEFRWKWMVVSKGGAAPDDHSGKVLTISFETFQSLSSEALKKLEKNVKMVNKVGKVFYPFSLTCFEEFKGYDKNKNLVKEAQYLYRLSFPIPVACSNYVVEWIGKKPIQGCNTCIDCDKDPFSDIRGLSAKRRTQSFFWGNIK